KGGRRNSFDMNILHLSPLDGIFCGACPQGNSRKYSYFNTLRETPIKIISSIGRRKSLLFNILRVNYLESIICALSADSTTPQVPQNEIFASFSVIKNIFIAQHSCHPFHWTAPATKPPSTCQTSITPNATRYPLRFAAISRAMGQ